MKAYLLHTLSLICTINLIVYTSQVTTSRNFYCTWFLYDNPAITDPSYDFPSTLIEATTVSNYVPISYFDLELVCNQSKVICAICAEVDNYGKPILNPNSNIVTNHLDPYFRLTNEYLRVPNTNFIKEKFFL